MKIIYCISIAFIFVGCKDGVTKNDRLKKHYTLCQMSLKDIQLDNFRYGDMKGNGFDSITEGYVGTFIRNGKKEVYPYFYPEKIRVFDSNGNYIAGHFCMEHGSIINKYDSLNLLIESDVTNMVDTILFKYKFVSDSLILYKNAYEVFKDSIVFAGLNASFKFNEAGRLILSEDQRKKRMIFYKLNGRLDHYVDSFYDVSMEQPYKCVTTFYYTFNHLDSAIEAYIFKESKRNGNNIIRFDKRGLVKIRMEEDGKGFTKYKYYKRRGKF